jgi:predicted esterase
MSGTAHTHAVRFYVAVALGVLAVSTGVLIEGRARDLRAASAGEPGGAAEGAIVKWCAAGLEAIPGGGCFALAPERTARAGGKTPPPPALLVYLHGRYAPETEAEELERQARVARMGTARGYSVLALRGKQGQCTDPQLATWWCWPSNERNAADGPAFVASWSTALAEAERRARPRRRVLLGFSNGGYFASLIAARALLPLDAVTVAHAGPVAPMSPVRTKPPMLLIDADDDPSSPEILHLDSDLTREGWPHAMVIREGTHALPEWDVEMALTFFDRVHFEPMPLIPPLAPPRPPHPHDAGAPVPDPEHEGVLPAAEIAALDAVDAAVAAVDGRGNADASANASADASADANASATPTATATTTATATPTATPTATATAAPTATPTAAPSAPATAAPVLDPTP